MRPFASFIAGLRYLFVLAVLAMVILAVVSLFRGIVQLAQLTTPDGFFMGPGSGAAVVPYFIGAAFLYFLAVALWSLFVTEIPAPQWMTVKNLFQLRTKVLTFVSIILPLGFMGKMMEAEGLTIGMFYSGAGVFLVLMGIYFLVRYGSPSGDEGMAREGNRVPESRSSLDRAPFDQAQGRREKHSGSSSAKAMADRGRRPQQAHRPRSRTDQDEWLKKQKEELKFQKDSLEKAVDKEISGETGGSHVTVKPGPRRPRGRR